MTSSCMETFEESENDCKLAATMNIPEMTPEVERLLDTAQQTAECAIETN